MLCLRGYLSAPHYFQALKGAEASSPPRWLASCAAGPGALGRAGWGVHSPAPLQELACRAVCAVVLEHCCGPPKGQQGLPAGVSISMLDFVRCATHRAVAIPHC